jgi:hypothetical protein
MPQIKLPEHIKTITVSGLYSNIGKTLLSQYLLGLLKNTAAIKITTTDFETFITDKEDVIMVEGKDTWRLKNGGASKVVWINSTEQDTLDSFKTSLSLVADYPIILIEGNSILKYLKPDLSFFICDAKILDYTNVKPSRKLALSKTDIIINNLREGFIDYQENSQVKEFCASINSKAEFINLDLKQSQETTGTFKALLNRYNL